MSTPNDDLLVNAMYIGMNLQDILYGVELVLYFRTIYVLLSHPGERTKADIFYVLFSTVMLLVVTVWISMQAMFGQRMWVLNADFPGGPGRFLAVNMWSWYVGVATMAAVVLQLMTDGLMVYRCWVIWENSPAMIIPLILWIATLVFGILCAWSTTVSSGLYLHALVTRISLVYYTISITLTAMLTCMICYRLLRYGKLMKEHLGREYASTYFMIFALIIESVLPCTLSGIACLISLGLRSQTELSFGYVYVLMTCISPQMLILRVAMRVSTEDGGGKKPSTVQFSPLEGTVSGFKAGCEGPPGSSQGNDGVV